MGLSFKRDSGMTLIDTAVFVTVIGLLAVPAIQQYNNYLQDRARGITESNMLAIDKALTDFYYANGRYPCPSNITAARTNPVFGREAPGLCLNVAVVPGTVNEGGVPFIALGLPEKYSLDGWNNRITYAVTDELRRTPWPGTPTGAITLHGAPQSIHPITSELVCGAAQLALYQNVHYILLSYGRNGAGAYPWIGRPAVGPAIPVQPCPVATQFGGERDNCDVNNDQVYYYSKCAANDVPGPGHYDDIMSPAVVTSAPRRTWIYSSNPVDIVTGALNIGINNPLPSATLDVMGNIRADNPAAANGNIVSSQICDPNGQNCFDPRSIAGIDPAMDCRTRPFGTSMSGIWDPTPADPTNDPTPDTSPNCGYFTPNTGTPCPAGQFVVGFDAAGQVICN